MRPSLALLSAAGLTLLSACSPYVYKTEIGSFSDGVGQISTTYHSGRQSLTDADIAKRRQTLIDARQRLDMTAGCSHVDPGADGALPDCAIVRYGDTEPAPPDRRLAAIAKAEPDITALEHYVAALNAVTNAADASALTAASNGLFSSVDSLSQAAAKIDPGVAAPAAALKAGAPLIAMGLNAYLDHRRYQALRAVVPALDPSVKVLCRTVQTALLDIRAVQVHALENQVTAARDAMQSADVAGLSAGDYQSRLGALEATVSAFNAARAADPAAVVAKLSDAHHALAQALVENKHQSKAVYDAVVAFAKAAGDLKTAMAAATAPPAKS